MSTQSIIKRRRRNVYLHEDTAEFLRRLGNGNISKGIRRAVAFYDQYHVRPAAKK